MGANAQTAVPVFTAGQVLTAQQQTEINTGIPVFATTVTRDAAFGGAGEKTLAEGQFAYIEATNTTQYYDGAAWQSVGASSGLTLISTTTIGTTVSSVTVSSAFSSTYDNYRINIVGGLASVGDNCNLTLGSTATGYYLSAFFLSYAGVASYVGTANGSSFVGAVMQNTNALCANIELQGPNLAKVTNFQCNYGYTGTTAGQQTRAGFLNDTTQYTAFTITPASGTLTGGTIRVYGYQNS